MAANVDVIPSLKLERGRVVKDIALQKANIAQMEFRLLEIEDERYRIDLSISSTKESIRKNEEKLASMPEA